MAIPVPSSLSGTLRRRASVPIILASIALGGCSINLGSLSSESDPEAPKPAPAGVAVAQAQAITTHAQVLAKSGKTEEALAEFDKAIELDPNNAQACTAADCSTRAKSSTSTRFSHSCGERPAPQQAEPLLGRAISYLALDKGEEAAADLDGLRPG